MTNSSAGAAAAASETCQKNRLAVAGLLTNNLSTPSPNAIKDIQESLSVCGVAIPELCLLFGLGWFLLPVADIFYNSGLLRKNDPTNKKFEDTYLYHIVESFCHIIRIILLTYVTDITFIILHKGLGIDFVFGEINLGAIVGKVTFIAWCAMRAKTLKRYLLSKAVDRSPNKLGKYALYDHLSDFFVFASAAMFICDTLSVEVGTGLTSVLAFGSMGTFAFSLASKDLCAQMLSSLAISAADKFMVGDSIKLGDGTAGRVIKIGWFNTIIQGHDNIPIQIPNTQLSNQRVSNISKVSMSQVKQIIYISNEHFETVPKLTSTIKEQIIEHCPQLIKDGKRPFRVVWNSIVDDRLEISIECHFSLPVGDEYWTNRQNMLMAISIGMKLCNIQHALPSSAVHQVCNTTE